MALEIPSLMSPVGVNSDIIQNGVNGYLPANEDEWIGNLSILIEDSEKRKQVGKKGRETVESKYSVHVWKDKYRELFNLLTQEA